MAKQETVHFSIDGKWLADFSRTRVEEGDYQHALRILDCLDGMTMDDKINILKGIKDLEGKNELNLIDGSEDLRLSVSEKYQWKYGSLLKFNGMYYKPYMIVNSWCMDDLPKSGTYYSPTTKKLTDTFEHELYEKMNNMFGGNRLDGYPHSRSMHYSYYPQTDLAFTFKLEDFKDIKHIKHKYSNGVVLFQEFKEQIPFWVEEYIQKHPQKAIESALKNKHYFEKNGAEFLYDSSIESNPLEIGNPYVQGNKYFELETEEEDDLAIEDLRKRIINFADNDKEYGWKYFTDKEGNTLKVPGRAFMHFALSRCTYTSNDSAYSEEEINLPKYSPLSKSGMKMHGDDPLHSDCWLGAGLDFKHAYDHDSWQHKLFMDSIWEMQYSFNEKEMNIIHRGKNMKIEGVSVNTNNYESVPRGQRILVIPNLSVDFEQAFFACDHIICETGGKLAHLATLAREFDKSIVRMENATLLFMKKEKIVIDFELGKIEYQPDSIKKKMKP